MTSKPISDEFFDDDLPASNCTDLIYWRALVVGGRARDWACTRLFVRYEESLKKKLKTRQIADHEITDLIHEIFIKVINKCENFRDSEKRFVDWFFAIAQNAATDHLRRKAAAQKREQGLRSYIEEMEEIIPHHLSMTAHTIAMQKCVHSSLQEFEKEFPKHARVIKLSIFEELGHKELARILDKEPGNAREYLSQCRKKFRPFVDHCKVFLDEDQ